MRRRKGSIVTGVHGLEHVDGLSPSNLTHDDPVRSHSKGIPHELADGHLALALDVRGTRFQRDDVRLGQPELRSILDGHQSFLVRDARGQDTKQRRLAGACSARDDHVSPAPNTGLQEREGPWSKRPLARSSCGVKGTGENFRMFKVGPQSERGGMIACTTLPHEPPDPGEVPQVSPRRGGIGAEDRGGGPMNPAGCLRSIERHRVWPEGKRMTPRCALPRPRPPPSRRTGILCPQAMQCA